MNRTPREPVEIPGLVVDRLIGSGGYSDVYLYRQTLPERSVAVKVLHDPVDDPIVRQRFVRETNLMAALSTHPSIVTVHAAAIAPGGRPYLVMEYCSRPTLAHASAERPPSVPEALQTLIRLAGAVETAHRSGILHRDIKPANVLTTDYGWPALTDFGISALVGGGVADEGVSVPWAAPEVVSGRGFDARSDVYGLAATAYTILAGRSPFDAGRPASSLSELVTRILTEPVPPLGRDDVPPALERLIIAALAKDPAARPQTASEFARSLQRIELDLNLPMTHLDVPADVPLRGGDDIGDRTELVVSGTDAAADAVAPDDERTTLSVRRGDEPADDHTVLSTRAATPPAPVDEATTLSARHAGAEAAEEERTMLSARGPSPSSPAEDRTVFSRREARALAPDAAPSADADADERTRLASRATPIDDADRTVFTSRPRPDAEDRTVLGARSGTVAPEPVDDATSFVRRAADSGLVRGRLDTTRQASMPGAASTERYTVRATDAPAPVQRTTITPPTPVSSASPASRRRRGRGGMVVALIGGTVVLLGAVGAAVWILITGGM